MRQLSPGEFARYFAEVVGAVGGLIAILAAYGVDLPIISRNELLTGAGALFLVLLLVYLEEASRTYAGRLSSVGGRYRMISLAAVGLYFLIKGNVTPPLHHAVPVLVFVYFSYAVLVVFWSEANYYKVPILGWDGRATRYVIDILVATGFVAADGGLQSPLVLLFALPIVTSARYFTAAMARGFVGLAAAGVLVAGWPEVRTLINGSGDSTDLYSLIVVLGLLLTIFFVVSFERRARTLPAFSQLRDAITAAQVAATSDAGPEPMLRSVCAALGTEAVIAAVVDDGDWKVEFVVDHSGTRLDRSPARALAPQLATRLVELEEGSHEIVDLDGLEGLAWLGDKLTRGLEQGLAGVSGETSHRALIAVNRLRTRKLQGQFDDIDIGVFGALLLPVTRRLEALAGNAEPPGDK